MNFRNPANGEISLKKGKPGRVETFQWMETLYGDIRDGALPASRPRGRTFSQLSGPKPDRKDGSCFVWQAE